MWRLTKSAAALLVALAAFRASAITATKEYVDRKDAEVAATNAVQLAAATNALASAVQLKADAIEHATITDYSAWTCSPATVTVDTIDGTATRAVSIVWTAGGWRPCTDGTPNGSAKGDATSTRIEWAASADWVGGVPLVATRTASAQSVELPVVRSTAPLMFRRVVNADGSVAYRLIDRNN